MYPRATALMQHYGGLGQNGEAVDWPNGGDNGGGCYGRPPRPEMICVDGDWRDTMPYRPPPPPPPPPEEPVVNGRRRVPDPEPYEPEPYEPTGPLIPVPEPVREVDETVIRWGGCPDGFNDVLDSSQPSGHRCEPIVVTDPDTGETETVVTEEEVEAELDRQENEREYFEEIQAAAVPGTTIVKVADAPRAPVDGAALVKKWLPVAAAVFLMMRGGGE